MALHDSQAEELDIEAALNLAWFIMTSAKLPYTQLSVDQKRRLLPVLSPGGFTHDGEKGLGSVTSDCLFNSL